MSTTVNLVLHRMRHRASRPDRGASLVEYALLVALIAIVCLVAVLFFGEETSSSFSRTAVSVREA
jgi:pilus assembly protein Flp/PilA